MIKSQITRHIVVFIIFLFTLGSASAETITVCLDGGCAYSDIQLAIDSADDGDVIEIAAGTYFQGGQIDTAGKAVHLRGAVDATGRPLTVLDGANDHGVLLCRNKEGADTILENLVVRNGSGNFGGGLYCFNSHPSIINCTFRDNRATQYYGGGVYLAVSDPVISNCRFLDNTAAQHGGGIYLDFSSPQLSNCIFEGNAASLSGGGLYSGFGSDSTVSACEFIANSAPRGGGIFVTSNTEMIRISTVTICGNTSDQIQGSFIDEGGNCIEETCVDCVHDLCASDLNQDDVVNGVDVGLFFAEWGCAGESACTGDFNQDGTVDGADLTYILISWGACPA